MSDDQAIDVESRGWIDAEEGQDRVRGSWIRVSDDQANLASTRGQGVRRLHDLNAVRSG